MLHISQLKLRGFKSFKYANLELPDSFVCLAGPNGSGKCVHGDSEVLLSDGSSVKIRDFVGDAVKNGVVNEIEDGFISYNVSKEILCLDTKTLKIVPKKVYAFVKRKSPKHLLKIKTRSGREVISTEYHPLFIFDGSRVRAVRADELKKGVRVGIPRKIDINPENKIFKELFSEIKHKDNIYVPFSDRIKKLVIKNKKTRTWKEFSKKAGVSYHTLKGLLDKQPINFSSLVKILRFCGLSDDRLISLIPNIKGSGKKKIYPLPWKNSNDFCRFLGYLLAEGQISKHSNQIRFTNGNKEIVKDYVLLVKKLFNEKATVNSYKKGCWDVLFYSAPLSRVLSKFGMSYEGTAGKFISNIVLKKSSNKNLGNLLNGLYSGDGYISKNSIEITTKSKNLANGIEKILFRLGIVPRTKIKRKRETKSGFVGHYHSISIFNTEDCQKFSNYVDLIHDKKKSRLELLLERMPNPNVDLIEVNALVKKVAKDLSINIKRAGSIYPKLDAYSYNQCTPSRFGTQQLIDSLFIPTSVENSVKSESLDRLRTISESNIFWDEVESVKRIKSKEKWVYDLSIEEHHNFIANNFFVHNSNLCDAIRFVMGEQSLRSLRVKKARDLIHSGLNSAEVVMVLGDEKKKKYELRRAIRTDGKILYKLNGKKTTRNSIMEMLKQYNLDDSGRNIIAQGRIQRIVEMTGKERRGIIESVAGISDYDKKKKEALKELDHVGTRIREANIVIGERSARLNELKKEKEIAIKYRQNKEQLKTMKASLIRAELDKLESDFQHIVSLKSKLLARVESKTKELEEMNSKIFELDKERNSYSKILKERQSELGDIKNIEKLKASIDLKNNLLVDREHSLKKLELQSSDLSKLIESEKRESGTILKELDSLRLELKKISPKSAEFRVSSSIESLKASIDSQRSKLFELKDSLSSIDSEINTNKEVFKLKSKQLEEIINELKSKKIGDSSEDESNLSSQASDISKEISKLFEEERKINYELANLDKELLKVREKAAQLKVQSSPQALNPALSVVRDLKESKKMAGIYGPVMDLISFEPKYTAAVEASLGGRLLYIVVDSTETATKLIKTLKKMKSGRATFIPLDRIKVKDLDRRKNLLINYISYNSKVSQAIDFVFSDTLLVDSISDAKKIKGSRIVTLEGEVFEKSGIITGGKLRGSLLASTQIKKLDQDADELRTKRKEFMFRLEEIREEGNQKRKEKAEIEVKLKSIEIERRAFQESAERINKLKSQKKELETELSNCESNLSSLSKKKQELGESMSSLAEEIKSLEEKLVLEEKKSKEEFELVSKKRSDVASKISSISATIEGKEKELGIRKTELRKRELELKNIKNEISSIVSEINQIKREIPSLSKDLRKNEEKIKKSSKEMEELLSKLNEVEEKIKKSSEQRGTIKIAIDNFYKEKHQKDVEEATIKTRLVDLKSEYEEYKDIEAVDLDKNELISKIKEAEQILNSIESVNMASIELYETKKVEVEELDSKISLLKDERKAIMKMIKEIERKKREIFYETFNAVNENFQKMMDAIPLGKGHLYLDNQEDPFESNLLIKINKHGRDASIDSLSGGESSLLALAFIFAIQFYKPSPFYVLDEADAALDKQNSKYFANLVTQISADSQFIAVSHNDTVIEGANAVLGVARVGNMSKIVGVSLDTARSS